MCTRVGRVGLSYPCALAALPVVAVGSLLTEPEQQQRIGGEDLRDDPVQIVKEGRPLPQDAAAIPDEDDQGSLSRDHDLVVVTPEHHF